MRQFGFIALAGMVFAGCEDATQPGDSSPPMFSHGPPSNPGRPTNPGPPDDLGPPDNPGAPFCIAPPAGIVSWWPGDRNASDVVGPNDAVLRNGATFAPGKVGHAFSFDAVDDVVGADADVIGELQRFTIEFWVKLDALRASGMQLMVTLGHQKAVVGLFEGRFFNFVMTIDGEAFFIGSTADNTPLQAGVFHHVVARYNGTRMLLLVDGVFVAGGDAVGTVLEANSLHFSGPDAFALGGLLDEITIYDRPLFFSEIRAIFDAGSAGKCKP